MHVTAIGNELSLFTDSTIQLLTAYTQSSLAQGENSIGALKMVIEGELMPENYQPMSKEEAKKLSLYVANLFAEWPKTASDEHVAWFNNQIYMPLTQTILESQAFKVSTSTYIKQLDSLGLSIIKRLRRLIRPHLKTTDDIDLCLLWCQFKDSKTIAQEMTSQFKVAIHKRIQILQKSVLQEMQKDETSMTTLFKDLEDFLQKTRGHYLYSKVENAEGHITQALQELTNQLLSDKELDNTDARLYFCNYLELTEEQRDIQQAFWGILKRLQSLEPAALLQTVLAIIRGEFQMTGVNRLMALSKHSQTLEHKISSWQPSNTNAGINRFEAIFIDYYFKPISQLLEYYGISLKRLPEPEIRQMKTTIAQAIMEYEKPNKELLPEFNLNCLNLWLSWYPLPIGNLYSSQAQWTMQLILKERKAFETSVKKNKNHEGFETLVTNLHACPVFRTDTTAQRFLHSHVSELIQSKRFKGFKEFLQDKYPEFCLDLTQYLLYITSEQLLANFKNTLQEKELSTDSIRKFRFDFSDETNEYSRFMDDLFQDELLFFITSSLIKWHEIGSEDILAFIKECIEYPAQAIRCNMSLHTVVMPNLKPAFDLINTLSGFILLQAMDEWKRLWSNKLPQHLNSWNVLKEGIICFLNNPETVSHSEVFKQLVKTKLNDYVEQLKPAESLDTEGKHTQEIPQIGSLFKNMICAIRLDPFYLSLDQAENVLHDEIHLFWEELKTNTDLKPMVKAKIKSAILADKRLSVKDEPPSPRLHRNPIHSLFSRTKEDGSQSPKLGRRAPSPSSSPTQFKLERKKETPPSRRQEFDGLKNISPETVRKIAPREVTLFPKEVVPEVKTENKASEIELLLGN